MWWLLFSTILCGLYQLRQESYSELFPHSQNDSTVLFVTRNFPANYKFKEKNTLNLATQKLNLPIEEVDRGFYFVVENNRIEHVFMPERQFDEYTQTYVKQKTKTAK